MARQKNTAGSLTYLVRYILQGAGMNLHDRLTAAASEGERHEREY